MRVHRARRQSAPPLASYAGKERGGMLSTGNRRSQELRTSNAACRGRPAASPGYSVPGQDDMQGKQTHTNA